jgi:hypothetical protein
VATTPTNHPDRAGRLSNLGNALRSRFVRVGDLTDLNAAIDGWAEATRSPVAAAATRLTAARQWADTVARRHMPAAAVDAYTEAITLLPLLAWRGISHHDTHHLLSQHAASLARDAAACAISAGRLDLAVELLEAGRGVYWAQLLGTRTDLTALIQVAPDLAEELHTCRMLLEQPTWAEPTSEAGSTPTTDTRHHAAHRFEQLVTQVRALPPTDLLPHPEQFLTPPALPTLLPDPGHTVVIINISQWRCDALLLTDHGVTLLALPDLTEEQVIDEASRYLNALHRFEATRKPTPADRLYLEMAMTATLEWLWDRITSPILTTLGHTRTPTNLWPRLWWCPTGALTVLPIHAAGYHHTGDSVIDRVVSSYTPTVSTLTRPRSTSKSAPPAKVLIVTIPDTPGQNQLPGTTTEQDLLATWFPDPARTVLAGTDATRRNILDHLDRHRWLHASCHGTQNLANPATGGLLPHDWDTAGLVTVTDLTNPDHTGGDFAFLSACKTATGGVTTLDEAISVATAMQHAGWRHVIGTLWSVWDDSAATITTGLYPQLLHNGNLDTRTAANALHHTTRTLRDTNPNRPSTWAPFIHTGP